MVKDVCLNGTIVNTNNYSSPVPLVGLYIAAASMVCFFLIFCDIWAALRDKRYWFPCRLFSINAVTLTLVSIAAKIPVDLTTTMPSQQDQLSKLFGTAFICVAMSFMLPSVARNAEFESYANVMALSIFVITVVVNICIQMATGVIFAFIPEHAVILIFMVFLLLRFWISVTTINVYKSNHSDVSKNMLRNGKRNMLARLADCYVYGYHSCPQLYACRFPGLGGVGIFSLASSIVLVQATLRSFIPKEIRFCVGRSDYGWSMWLVVGSQSLTIAVVTLAMAGRWFINAVHASDVLEKLLTPAADQTYLQFQYLFSLRNLPSFAEKTFKSVIYLPLFVVNCGLLALNVFVHYVLSHVCQSEYTRDKNSDEFMVLLKSRDVSVDNWVLQQGVEALKSLMEKDEKATLNHLVNLLSTISPSHESSFKVGPDGEGIQISLLSMMLLAEIAKLVGKVSLTSVLDEVFEILLLIDNKVNTGSSKDRLHSQLAKVIHHYGLTSGLAEFVLEQDWDLENDKVDFKFVRRPVCGICAPPDLVCTCIREVTSQVSDFISYRPDESGEVVCGRIEQLFVDMLHAFLAQLPVAVFMHILESSVEEYQERVRLGMSYISKLQSVESQMRFSLPPGSNITSLFRTQAPATTTQAEDTQVQGIAPTVEAFGEIQEDETRNM